MNVKYLKLSLTLSIFILSSDFLKGQQPLFQSDVDAYFGFSGNFNSNYPTGLSKTVGGVNLTTDKNGVVNSALYFDGVNDTFSFSLSNQLSTNFSIFFWANPSKVTSFTGEKNSWVEFAFSTPRNPLLEAPHGQSKRGFGIDLGTNGLNVVNHGENHYNTSLSKTINLSGWSNYVFVCSNNRASVYKNGAFLHQGLSVNEQNILGVNLRFGLNGMTGQVGSIYYQGKLDEITVYNRVLNSNEVLQIHNSYLNQVPTITSNGGGGSANKNVSENQTGVTTVSATDPDAGTTLTYSISGGVDAGKFQINGNTGVLSFKTAPDFENPTDSGANNGYVVKVRASDGALHDEQTITVNVTNVNEHPSITSNGAGNTASKNVSENQTGVTTVSATDPDAGTTITYSISGGVDAENFKLMVIREF